MRHDERLPNLVSELTLDDIWPHFWQKMVKNWQNRVFCQFSTIRFLSKRAVNVIQFQFWGQIWSPLIKALFIPQNERNVITLFFDPHCNFKTLVARARVWISIGNGLENLQPNSAQAHEHQAQPRPNPVKPIAHGPKPIKFYAYQSINMPILWKVE